MIAFLALISLTSSQTPLTPVWPNVFWQPFTETMSYPIIGTHSTTGNYYYDWTIQAYRIDRANGRYDKFCGLAGPYEFDNTPCSHIVNNGNRFLYYSEKNTCCFCCNAEQGCGMLYPTWMNNSIYIDTEIHNGVQTYKWNKVGDQANYIYETVGQVPVNRVTVSIYQGTDDAMDFGARSESLPNGILDLPSICNLNNKCTSSFCEALRIGEGKFVERI